MTAELTLVLETSGRVGRIGLGTGDRVLVERRLDPARRHARDLAPVTAELLAETGHSVADFTGVVVGLGPGSYTGLRVGIASAQALAYARGIPAYGVPTFTACARSLASSVERAEIISDAHLGKLYWQLFHQQDGEWAAESDLMIVSIDEWLTRREPGRIVSGPGVEIVETHIRDNAIPHDEAGCEPRLTELLDLGGKSRPRTGVAELIELQPIYGRPSSAELNFRKP